MTVAARQLRIISTSPHPEHPCLVLWCEQIPSRVSWHSVRQTQEPTNRLGCQQMLVPRFCSVPSQALTGPHCRLSTGAGGVAHLSRMVETDPLCVAARRAAVHVSLAGPPGGSYTFSYTMPSFGSRPWEIFFQGNNTKPDWKLRFFPRAPGFQQHLPHYRPRSLLRPRANSAANDIIAGTCVAS